MQLLSVRLRYALAVMLFLAARYEDEPVQQSKDVTAAIGMRRRYMEPTLQLLTRAGFLKGIRGPNGGYTLCDEWREITVGEMDNIVSMGGDYRSSTVLSPEIQTVFDDLTASWRQSLAKITLLDLLNVKKRAK